MRNSKLVRQAERSHAEEHDGFVALSTAWNCHLGLRQGDRVHTAGQYRENNFQPNTWSHDGLVACGWNEVGQGYSRHAHGEAGVGESRRCLDALGTLASCVNEVISQAVASFLDEIPDGGTVHINRHFDPTPLILSFGRFQEDLQFSALYL